MNDPRLSTLFPEESPIEKLNSVNHPKIGMIRGCTDMLCSGDGCPRPEGAVAFFIPGRIEILGKHTDYCGGRSLLCAVDRGFVMVARKRSDQIVRITRASSGESRSFELSHAIEPAMGQWWNYPMTTARRLAKNFGNALRGVEIVFASDLPPAAGLSSSSAFIVGTFLAIASLNSLDRKVPFKESIHTLEDLAHYCGCIENGAGFRTLDGMEGVGTSGGSQDHTAILCCKPKTLSIYGFAPVKHEQDVALSGDLALIVVRTKVTAEKTGSARKRYNALSETSRRLVSIWNANAPRPSATLSSIVRSEFAAVAVLQGLIEREETGARTELRDRLDQFVEESELIVPAAARALAENQLGTFSRLIARSTDLAVAKLKNQIPETIQATQAALGARAIAASPFGAGFGGSVWAICERTELDPVLRRIRESPACADAIPVNAIGGAASLS